MWYWNCELKIKMWTSDIVVLIGHFYQQFITICLYSISTIKSIEIYIIQNMNKYCNEKKL